MSDSDNRYTQPHENEQTTDTDDPTDGTTTSDGTMHLTVGGSDYERILDTLAAVDRGETPEPYYSRSFASLAELHRALAPTNLTLLRVIVRKQPESIRATARAVDRDVKEVHRNLNELEQRDQQSGTIESVSISISGTNRAHVTGSNLFRVMSESTV